MLLSKLVFAINLAASVMCAAMLLGIIRFGPMTPTRKRILVVLLFLTFGIALMYIPRVL